MSKRETEFRRPQAGVLAGRLGEVRRFIQVVAGIKVKSGNHRESLPGMEASAQAFRPQRTLLVGGDGNPVEEFLSGSVKRWVAAPHEIDPDAP